MSGTTPGGPPGWRSARHRRATRRGPPGRPSPGCCAAGAGSGSCAGTPAAAGRSAATASASSGWSAACSSMQPRTAPQNSASASRPSSSRIPARCRRKPSKTSVRIGSGSCSGGSACRIRSADGGQRLVAQDGDLLADVLHQHPHRHTVAQHHDQVLAVRHERQVVPQQAVHQRAQVRAQVGLHPLQRGHPRATTRLATYDRPSASRWSSAAIVASCSPGSSR